MISSSSDRRRAHLASAAVALLLLTGCASTHTASAHDGAEASVVSSPPTTSVTAQESLPEPQSHEVLTASEPITVEIASTGTHSELISLGLRSDGTLEVPPDEPGAPAAWFNGSPTPGERGPSVIYGHVNATDGGPGVFADLRSLVPGDTIRITRTDGTTAVFATDRGEQYSKAEFPTEKVYGNTDGAELRLITCDGYDPKTGEFDDNYVVYANFVSSD